jgi:chromosome segregation ATPase
VQRDGLQARVTQLERELEDHKDNNAKLQRQLDNWQGLKKGDDVDLEILRKKNVELEVQLREANAVIQERDKALEKEKGRTTKLKEVLHDWKVRFFLRLSRFMFKKLFIYRPKPGSRQRSGNKLKMRLQMRKNQQKNLSKRCRT